jgi:hypothetical protein
VNPNGHARPGESEVEILSKFSLQIYNVPWWTNIPCKVLVCFTK